MDDFDIDPIIDTDFKLKFTENMINISDESRYIPGNLDIITNPNILHESYEKCRKGVSWKNSVQKFGINELRNTVELRNSIENGTYKQDPVYEFKLNERGHIRDIKSHSIRDRVIQKALNEQILLPRLSNLLIYDNGASLEGKGISFSRSRFEYHLRDAYKKFNGNGYILLMDFSKFFDNINHEYLLEQFRPYLNDYEFAFIENCFREFEIDVSYMTDEEFSSCINTIFNSLDYAANVDRSELDGSRMMRKSVGIGSQTSQISGIFYPHEIDNYCKIVKGIKYYGRYMDDTYIILQSKEELENLFIEIENICTNIGIFINKKKTCIISINGWIPYLKVNYLVNENAGLIRKVNSEVFRREHRRLTKFSHLLSQDKMTLDAILNCYKSWRGSYKKYDSGYDILKLDNYVKEIFQLPPTYKFKEKT